jgi:hypothetical protein
VRPTLPAGARTWIGAASIHCPFVSSRRATIVVFSPVWLPIVAYCCQSTKVPLLEEEPIAFDSRRAYCNANASPSSSNSIVPFLLDFSTSTAVVPEAGAVTVAVTVAWPPSGMSRCMVP